MNFITIDTAILYYYFKSNILYGISLGGVSNTILAQLPNNYNKYVVSYIGDDSNSNIILSDLNKLNINTDRLIRIDNNTSIVFIQDNKYTSICPYCNRSNKYYYPSIDINLINKEDNIIIDNLYDSNLSIINNIENDIYICLNSIDSIKYLDLDTIYSLNNKFKIIVLNKEVFDYIQDKFKIDSIDLYNILNPYLLVIYNLNTSIDFIYNDIIESKTIDSNKIIDSNGSIEVITATIIDMFISNNMIIDSNLISLMYIKSLTNSLFVESKLGNISNLIELNKVNSYRECICKNVTLTS